MSGALGWLSLAAAALVAPGFARDTRPVRAAAAVERAGPVVAASLVAAACVLVGGLPGLAVALIMSPATLLGLRALQRRPVAAAADASLPLVLDLAAAGLRAGKPVPAALSIAAPAGSEQTAAMLRRVAGLLELGSSAAQAWAPAARGPLAPVAPVAVRSAASGVKLAGALEGLARTLREERAAGAAARAARVGVAAMAPLAACFLPSFVCLGVVPVVVGIARTALGGALP
ncbi:type II secretion system F family protein [uncultured Jatrophihabitans sp.]|uniref:type II secretion system F family protein n=1 Tax=uncultured Jatrophihabitans sp. TaxID=1610747 RepID=UPI0035C96AD5